VQAAVKAAVAKHAKFKVEPPREVTISYLIRGIPAPDTLLKATLGEAQAFADDVAAHIAGEQPQLFEAAGAPVTKGAILSINGHLILGIPPVLKALQFGP
jgi:hypothetical protein